MDSADRTDSAASAGTADTSRRQWLAAGLGTAALAAVPAWAQQPGGDRVLRVGHQKGWLSLLKARGTLEKRLAPLGAKVTWTEFNAGPVQLEALNVGAIDFGDVGEAPPIFAQAAGAPLVYAGATVPRPAVEALVVPKGSAIRSVADLKGKRVAYNKGSNVHYFLVKLLEKHGLQYRDVQSVFLAPPDARAAFERGAVDAWVIWDPFLASAEKTLGARVLADATGVANNRAFYFTSRDFATRNADVLRIAIDEVNAVDTWISRNKSEAAAELSQVLGLDRSITELFVGRVGYGTRVVTREILAEQQAIADTFFDLKLIPKKLNVLHAAPVDLS
ncbi:sulfonate ABC transporter substrate-binding protein [Paracidovorax konjaci]|uniref:sulfonate ABC transporter substrate-binding protein n=1 Tax=Paracidovorax konjaci TaxID=32040 RepID=UPI003EC151CA